MPLPLAFALALLPGSEPVPPIQPSSFFEPIPVQEPYSSPRDRGLRSDFRYDYVGAGLSVGDFTGAALEGSAHLQNNWLIVGNFEHLTRSNRDFTAVSGGVGFVMPVQENFDLVGTAQLEYGRTEVTSGPVRPRDSEFGARLRGGARFQVAELVEVFGGVGVRTIFDNDLRLDAGALYDLTERISVLGRLEVDDNTQVILGVRLYF